jgi:membrane protease YdiL (CAAX protease family)
MRSPLREALLVFGVSVVANAGAKLLGIAIPFVGSVVHALVAAVFIYLPVAIAWRRKEDLSAYGFTLQPLGRSAAFAGGTMAVVFPLFLVGYVVFQGLACAFVLPPGVCARFVGWAGLAHPQLPDGFLEAALTQVIVVAIPEELFFRGYLLKRLEEAFPPRRRILGGGIGVALVISAVLFGLSHVQFDLNPMRMATFFPALLFGWLRSATGSIAAGAAVHAASNLYIATLQRTFFP